MPVCVFCVSSLYTTTIVPSNSLPRNQELQRFRHCTVNLICFPCSEALRSILDKLLCVDSDSRPSASDILNSPSVQEHGRQLHISLEDDSKMNSNLKPSTQPASTGRSVKGTTEERLGVSKRTKSGSPSAAQSSPGMMSPLLQAAILHCPHGS